MINKCNVSVKCSGYALNPPSGCPMIQEYITPVVQSGVGYCAER